jgi:hypothetical protein
LAGLFIHGNFWVHTGIELVCVQSDWADEIKYSFKIIQFGMIKGSLV